MPINCDVSIKLDTGFWLLLGLVLLFSVIGWENAIKAVHIPQKAK